MKAERDRVILAFYPNARGFAHVVFEGPLSPVDWGISDVPRRKGRLDTYARRLSVLIGRYRPDLVVLREGSGGGENSGTRAWVKTAKALAGSGGIPTVTLSRVKIREAFAYLEPPTRYAIAKAIAREIPIFSALLPPVRKIWNGEDRRMGLFDAASLALSYMQQDHQVGFGKEQWTLINVPQ